MPIELLKNIIECVPSKRIPIPTIQSRVFYLRRMNHLEGVSFLICLLHIYCSKLNILTNSFHRSWSRSLSQTKKSGLFCDVNFRDWFLFFAYLHSDFSRSILELNFNEYDGMTTIQTHSLYKFRKSFESDVRTVIKKDHFNDFIKKTSLNTISLTENQEREPGPKPRAKKPRFFGDRDFFY